MTTWRLEQEEYYLRILDGKKNIAGYFDPDYGEIVPKEREEELIDAMWRNHDPVPGGHMMVGMVKFGIFQGDYNSDITGLEERLGDAATRISQWKEYLSGGDIPYHYVNISHTDQDMLTVTFPVRFAEPAPLGEKGLRAPLSPVLDGLQRHGLV
ncbi:hypothetical protein CENSYa_0499 [Cenarchaeum symbiosum A]|uniref:Uncharacterized protein n=1 Tax=Cenarchaeum symbiosum (strain A) TaxID=414004 RepID=A0RUW5_CENSY|nr:hypothetical protein CENSYa_0499 [Cenarchaeum symbiosum A]